MKACKGSPHVIYKYFWPDETYTYKSLKGLTIDDVLKELLKYEKYVITVSGLGTIRVRDGDRIIAVFRRDIK